MAVPPEAVGSPKTSARSSDGTSLTLALPDGSNVAGRRLIAIVGKDGSGAVTWPEGWKTPGGSGASGAAGTAAYASVRYMDLTGEEGFPAEGASVTVTGASEEWEGWVVLLEKGTFLAGTAPEMAAATGTSSSGNPPNLTPSWGTDAVAWIAAVVVDSAASQSGPSAYPTNYTSWQYSHVSSANSGSVIMGVGARLLESDSSDDPSAFTNRSDDWRAVTIGVRGGAGAEPPEEEALPTYRNALLSGFEIEATKATLSVPSGSKEGDALLAAFMVTGTGLTITPPEGWKILRQGTGPQTTETVVIARLAAWDGETSSYDFGWGGATRLWQGGILAAYNCDASEPVNVIGEDSHVNGEEKDPVPVKAISTTVDDCLLVAFTFNGNGFFAQPPSGWTERVDQLSGPNMATKNTRVATGEQAAIEVDLNSTAEWSAFQIALQPQQEGGEEYVREVADDLAIDDARSLVVTKVLASDLALGDATAKAAAKVLADGLALADERTVVRLLARSVQDGLALADARSLAISLALADGLALDDLAAGVAAYLRAPADGLALADDPTAVATFVRAAADTLALADARALAAAVTIADTLGIDDQALRVHAASRALADTLALDDVARATVALVVDDALALADALTKTVRLTIVDALAAADNQARATATAIADTLALLDEAEAALSEGATNFKRSLEDGLALADALVCAVAVQVGDGLAISDASQRAWGAKRVASDALGLADARARRITLSASDGLALADARALRSGLLVADGLALADGTARAVGLQVADRLALAESLTRRVAYVVALAEALGLDDAATAELLAALAPGFGLIDDAPAGSGRPAARAGLGLPATGAAGAARTGVRSASGRIGEE